MFPHAGLSASLTLYLDDGASLAGIYADRDCLPRKRKSTTQSRFQPTRSQAFVDKGRPRGGIFDLASISTCQPEPPPPTSSTVHAVERMVGPSTLLLAKSEIYASGMERRRLDLIKTSSQGTISKDESLSRQNSSSSVTKRREIRKCSSSSTRSSNESLADMSIEPPGSCGYQQDFVEEPCSSTFEQCSFAIARSSQSTPVSKAEHHQGYHCSDHTGSELTGDEFVPIGECTDFCGMVHPYDAPGAHDQTHDTQTTAACDENDAVGGLGSEDRWANGGINNTSWLDDDSASDDSETEASVDVLGYDRNSERSGQNTPGRLERATTISPTKPLLVSIPQQVCTRQNLEGLPSAQAQTFTPSKSSITPTDFKDTPKALSLRVPITPPETPNNSANPSPDLEQKPMPRLAHKMGLTSLPRANVDDTLTPPTTPEKVQAPPLTIGLPTILTMLEAAINGFPLTALHLRAPVIRLIRSLNSSTVTPTTSVDSPSSTLTWPSSPSFASNITTAQSSLEGKTFQCPPIYPEDDERHLAPFTKIFPDTADFFRGDLYAHFLAQNFLDSLPSPKSPLSSVGTLSDTASPKALKMLGVAFISRPAQETIEMRISKIKSGLKVCIGRLMEAMCGRGRGEGDELLVAAVGQTVKMIEEGKIPCMD